MSISQLSRVFLFLTIGAGVLHAGNVRIAERPQAGPFPTIQAAVDAALEGESLLVTAGNYPAFTIDAKAVRVFAADPGVVKITGSIVIRNITTAQSVILSRLTVTPTALSGGNLPALDILGVTGHVRVQNCTITGAGIFNGFPEVAMTSVRVSSCLDIVFSNCGIFGADAYYAAGEEPYDGGVGLDSIDSSIALYSCSLFGGDGSDESNPQGGNGGPGYRGVSYGVFASGCTFKGGRGGSGDGTTGCTPGGAGGGGLVISAGQAHLLEGSFIGGVGGWSCTGPTGAAGQPIVTQSGAIIDNLPGTKRTISATRITADDVPDAITISGQPGDTVFLMFARRPSFVFKKPLNGVWMVPTPMLSSHIATGTIGANGTLVVNRTFAIADGTVVAQTTWMQAMCIDTAGHPTLTGPEHVLSLDAASAPDCNGNARQDVLDVLFGGAPDCDHNLTPDSCDVDCDGSGIPDACEIASGALADCNGNAVPDVCDIASGTPDCNGNGVPDSCDIASHASPDVNANGVSDECEAQFQTWYVDASAAPGGNGSQAFPFQSLQPAVAAAFFGDTIVIADGVYQGPSNRGINTGGRDLTIRSAHGPSACIIDCQNAASAFSIRNHEQVTIEGITIQSGTSVNWGGAIDVEFAGLVLRNCVITGCNAPYGGGAVYVYQGSLQLEECAMRGNQATLSTQGKGGALAIDRATVSARGCLFAESTGVRGGAVYISPFTQTEPITFTHCAFLQNHGDSGGALRDYPALSNGVKHKLDNCLFAGNTSNTDGGALYTDASLAISNSTFTGNRAVGKGGALYQHYYSITKLDNSVCHGNAAGQGAQICVDHGGNPTSTLTVTYSDVQGDLAGVLNISAIVTWGSGNLDLDPQFTDADGPDNDPQTFADNDYSLSSSSPCVDAGNNGALILDLLDVDGDGDTTEIVPLDLRRQPRRVDVISVPDTGVGAAPIVDMGALERQG